MTRIGDCAKHIRSSFPFVISFKMAKMSKNKKRKLKKKQKKQAEQLEAEGGVTLEAKEEDTADTTSDISSDPVSVSATLQNDKKHPVTGD